MWLDFDKWWGEIVFWDKAKDKNMSRWDVIKMLADKDGGAHFDPTIPIDYYALRQPTSLRIIVDGQVARFNQNPVYVSVRQIAWEVLESWNKVKKYGTNEVLNLAHC